MHPATVARHLEAHPLFEVLGQNSRQLILRESQVVAYRPRRPVLREGEPPDWVFFLLAGAVRVFHRHADGNEILVKMFRAPVVFGEMEVLGERPYLEYVTTLEPSEVLKIPGALFARLVRSEPRFCEQLTRDLAQRLCIATCNERMLAFCDVETRLASVLLDYAALSGTPVDGGVRLSVPLSQESLAKDLGVSRKSVTRAMDAFRQQGLLDKDKGRFLLRDVEALRRKTPPSLSLVYRLRR